MKISKITLLLCMPVLLAGLALHVFNASAEEKPRMETAANLKEMPLLTGDLWQKMTQDEKVAFVWGVGHVVTLERESMERNPELKRDSFAAKMCKGMAGVPMNTVVSEVDRYYRENPGKSSDPVMKVIWDKIVQPKVKTGAEELPSK